MSLELPFGIKVLNPIPVDEQYLDVDTRVPYVDIATANIKVEAPIRYLGLTVAITIGGETKEYWYKEGLADINLIEKLGGSTPGVYSIGVPAQAEIISTIGGFLAGTPASALDGRTFSSLWDQLLYPDLEAQITVFASASLELSGSGLSVEVGSSLNISLTAIEDLGLITDGDLVGTQQLLADLEGLSNDYTFQGTNLPSTPQASDSILIPPFQAVLGNISWNVDIRPGTVGFETYFSSLGNVDSSATINNYRTVTTPLSKSSPIIVGSYFRFVGWSSVPVTDSTIARNLPVTSAATVGQAQYNTTATETLWAILVPTSLVLSAVEQVPVAGGSAVPITITATPGDGNYVIVGTITVEDAGGNGVLYNRYEMTNAIPYSEDHYHIYKLINA